MTLYKGLRKGQQLSCLSLPPQRPAMLPGWLWSLRRAFQSPDAAILTSLLLLLLFLLCPLLVSVGGHLSPTCRTSLESPVPTPE